VFVLNNPPAWSGGDCRKVREGFADAARGWVSSLAERRDARLSVAAQVEIGSKV